MSRKMLAFHPWQTSAKFLLLLQTFHYYLASVTGQQMTLTPFKYDISQKYPENFDFQEKSIYSDVRKRRTDNLDTLRNRILDNKELSWKLSTNKFQRKTKTPDPRKMMAIDISSLNRNGIKMGRGGGSNSAKHSRLPSLMDVDMSILSGVPDTRFPLSRSVSHMMEPLRSPYDRLPAAINEPPMASSRAIVPKLNNEQNDIVVFPLFQLPFKAVSFYQNLLGEGKKGSKNPRQDVQSEYAPLVYMPASRRNIPKMLADMTSHKIIMLKAESQKPFQKIYDQDQLVSDSSEESLQQ